MRPLSHIILAKTPAAVPVKADKGVYRKEIIYPGNFVKQNDDGSIAFELPVDESLMDHWESTFRSMKASGVEVPLPIEHTTDPEKRRGTVVDIKKEFNPDRGENSLYAYIRFRDPQTAAALSKTSQVSLYAPPKFTDGKGKTYVRPIRHVAITDYPLIPNLNGWESVKASIVLSEMGSTTMTLAECMDRLGITYPEGADDETMFSIMEEAWNAEPAGEEEEEEGETVDEEVLDEETVDEEEEGIPASITASAVNAVCSARETELSALVTTGHITPAQKKELAKQFASKTSVAFVLSHGEEISDGYDSVIASLKMNTPRKFGEKTPAQHVTGEKSPLVLNAERRAQKGK